MRAPTWIVRFVTWRWMPSVALVVGSLAFAGVAILVVPDDFGGVASGVDNLSRATRSRVATNLQAPAEEAEPSTTGEIEAAPTMPPHRLHSPRLPSHDVVQSIFHSTRAELPVEPVDPDPQQQPPPPPPPPAPTATIFTLDNTNTPMPTNLTPPPPPPPPVEPPPGVVPEPQ